MNIYNASKMNYLLLSKLGLSEDKPHLSSAAHQFVSCERLTRTARYLQYLHKAIQIAINEVLVTI